MKLTFLGTGAAYNVDEGVFHSNMLLESDDEKFLLDCGGDIRHSLHRIGYSFREINSVYISHLHADHCFGLEWLGMNCHYGLNGYKPRLYIRDTLASCLWQHILKGAMTDLGDDQVDLSSYFDVQLLKDQEPFVWKEVLMQPIEMVHCVGKSHVTPSYGLFMTTKKQKTFITTDTQFTPEILMKYYEAADVIFHDCETSLKKTGVHAHFNDLKTLSSKIKEKMWLYHYSDGPLPDAVAAGFCGFVKPREEFKI